MDKFMKPRKAARCFYGRKAIIVKNIEDGSSDQPRSWALVAGIDHYPCKVTAAIGNKTIAQRSKSKSFVKVYIYNHLMPTRYSVDILLDKTIVDNYVFRDPALQYKARLEDKVNFEEGYKMSKKQLGLPEASILDSQPPIIKKK
uniref:60S ribosomal protein L27-like n=1 Tax=Jaculus jaculus TaxID=51337 RepID=UPI001E1B0781|nr:60S ribosomal protein L27-like [Jaculus jaculus]